MRLIMIVSCFLISCSGEVPSIGEMDLEPYHVCMFRKPSVPEDLERYVFAAGPEEFGIGKMKINGQVRDLEKIYTSSDGPIYHLKTVDEPVFKVRLEAREGNPLEYSGDIAIIRSGEGSSAKIFKATRIEFIGWCS